MKLEDIVNNMKDGPTTAIASLGLIVTGVSYFKDTVAVVMKSLSDMGYTITPDKETWLYVGVALLFLDMIFLRGGKKE